MKSLRGIASCFTLALAGAGAMSCAQDNSSIEVAISTEAQLSLVDSINLTVSANGETVFSPAVPYDVATTTFPGTFLVQKSEKTAVGTPITVTVTGLLHGQVQIVRTATLSFVDSESKLLQMPLEMACVGMPACPSGQTCKQGACESDVTDPAVLPNFASDQVFGQDGTCFDRDACVTDSQVHAKPMIDPTVDDRGVGFQVGSCTVDSVPGLSPEAANMGIFWAMQPSYWVVVNFDPAEGWSFDNSTGTTRIKLAQGLCDTLQNEPQKISALFVGNGCAPKVATLPECSDPDDQGAAGAAGASSGAAGAAGAVTNTAAGAAGVSSAPTTPTGSAP